MNVPICFGLTLRSFWSTLILMFLCLLGMSAQSGQTIPIGVDSLTQLERLPLLREHVWFHAVGSEDVTGGNDDGFTARFSDQYVENGRYVLLDTRGPACVLFSWTSRIDVTNNNKMSFEGDLTIETISNGKQQKLVLPFSDFYAGDRKPFLSPLVRNEKEGRGSASNFVPICSEDGIKISTDKGGTMLFYNIFYHTYSLDSPVKALDDINVQPALDRWKRIGEPFDSRPSQTTARKVDLPAHTTVPIWSASEPGTVSAIYLKLSRMTDQALRHVRIKAYWDGQYFPAVNSPIGPFFGTGYWSVPDPAGATPRFGFGPSKVAGESGRVELGRIATEALPVGLGKDGFYNVFPMPFFRSARIELANDSDTPVSQVEINVQSAAGTPPASSAYFHAQWREENPTLAHRDYTVLETRGHGHYVGAVLVLSSVNYNQAKQNKGQRWYLEGDARFYIDGNRTLVGASTGSEDYYLGGWYDVWTVDKVMSASVTGDPVHDIDSQDHTVAYRFHLGDLVPYYRSFRFALEHGPEGNLPTNYSSTAFFYQVDTPSLELTDQFAMDDVQSEQSHAYIRSQVVWQGCRDLPFEGDGQITFTRAYREDSKRGTRNAVAEALHQCGERTTGTIEFTTSILSGNTGIKLRRLLDYSPSDVAGQETNQRPQPLIAAAETAHVFVDGTSVGEWYTAPRHARLAWLEDDYEIPAKFTGGKQQLKIRLEIAPGTSWSAYQYRTYSYMEK